MWFGLIHNHLTIKFSTNCGLYYVWARQVYSASGHVKSQRLNQISMRFSNVVAEGITFVPLRMLPSFIFSHTAMQSLKYVFVFYTDIQLCKNVIFVPFVDNDYGIEASRRCSSFLLCLWHLGDKLSFSWWTVYR